MAVLVTPPCVVFEDDHLLVVNKPPGLGTHSPSPYSGEGIYEWLRNREPRWASLSIIHRLDKATSGLLVFGKTQVANRSLTAQFTERAVEKDYLFITRIKPPSPSQILRTGMSRAGEKYFARDTAAGDIAETRFEYQGPHSLGHLVLAQPKTGRTHQIRVHAASAGFPILGDELYGGECYQRLCLHAAGITFKHPETGERLEFKCHPEFDQDARFTLRQAIINSEETDSFRVIHGASDRFPAVYVDRWGEALLASSEDEVEASLLRDLSAQYHCKSAWLKRLDREVRKSKPGEASPKPILGSGAGTTIVHENGIAFEISFSEGYSVGLFLDQRENRRRLLTGYVAPGFQLDLRNAELLNTFAYTCGFSVCAAAAGARTTSLDLSKKYLDWGKRNFQANSLSLENHDFIYGDVFDWAKRLHKKGKRYSIVMADPPTFSQAKTSGPFRAEADFEKLLGVLLPLLLPGGTLFASTNAHRLAPEKFIELARASVFQCGRKIAREHYAPQPVDFPVSKDEPAYLKTLWLRVA